jgi:hypothetical protein
MAADEQSCRADNAAEDAFRTCMRDRGWFIASSLGALNTPAPVAVSGAGTDAEMASAPQTAASPAASSAETLPGTRAGLQRAATVAAPVVDTDPTTPLAVGSWWKFGGNADGLERDIAACIGKLGSKHRPSPAATVVTRAMHACLKEHGWYAMGK